MNRPFSSAGCVGHRASWTERVDVGGQGGGVPQEASIFRAALSGDGRFVAFASASPDLGALARPAPAVVANARPAAKGAPVVVDDDRSEEALLLVHEWKLPGDEKSLGDRLGGQVDLPGGRPAWSVERTGARGYRVTFQPREKDLPYAFEADIESRVVWPTPETQELLAPRFTAAFRDAVR